MCTFIYLQWYFIFFGEPCEMFGSQSTSSSAVGQISCTVINTSNEAKLLQEIWMHNFSKRIKKRVFVGSIVNIRNDCLFVLGSRGMNQSAEQINRLRAAHDLFFPCSDSFPINLKPEVSDETGALLVYSCLITYKSFSHRPTSTEHAE